ncbi:MAG: type II secretion system F family protein [Lachnospiraceae bacterium]|nr:type II secretion system F family protein [Lachnospiraceae bacterium]
MPAYAYEAVDKMGKKKRGNIEAASTDRAQSMLKGEGLIPLKVSEQSFLNKDVNIGGSGVSKRDLSVFCRQFVSILNAGVPIVDAMGMMEDQTENKRLKKALGEVKANIAKGESFANALRERSDIFPSMMINMVEAGEASGSIDVSLDRMATQFEKDTKMAGMVKKALIYPIVVVCVAIIVMIVMMAFVIPNFMEMFKDMDTKMPGLTLAVMAAADFFKAYWYLVLGIIVVIVIALKVFSASQVGTEFLSKAAISIPAFKNFTVKTSSSRLARTLATLTSSGISMIDALDIAAKTMTNYMFRQAVIECKEEVKKGVPLSEPLKRSGLFPPMVVHMTKIGEETGDMDSMLTKMADYYDEEVEAATANLMSVMEPVIILVIAVFVGILVGACVMPMLSLYKGLDNI